VRADSLIMSFQTILVKVSAALAMLVLGIGVAVSDLPTIDLMTNTFSGEVTDKSLLILRSFMFLLPLPLIPIGLIIYKKTYSLNGSFYDNMKAELEARRAIKSEETIGAGDPIDTQDYEDDCVKVVDVDVKDIIDSEK
jgi:Na+/melibiose symporter-like transporter